MPFVTSGDVRLFVEETGSGHPVVFVHEFGSDYREWESQVRWFSRHYRCVAFNARGYPPSDVPEDPSAYGYEAAVEDIVAVMAGLRIDKAHVVGLSMGGYAALQLGLRHPHLVTALVAAGAGTGSPPSLHEAWKQQAAAMAQDFLTRGMAAVAEEMGRSPTRIQLLRKDPRGWNEFMAHLRGHSARGMSNTVARYQGQRPSLHDFREQFSRMRIPTLLAVGDEDAPCLETNLMLKETLPTAGLWICPNTGHAINLEEPAAFNQAVQDFFSAVERGRWRGQG